MREKEWRLNCYFKGLDEQRETTKKLHRNKSEDIFIKDIKVKKCKLIFYNIL